MPTPPATETQTEHIARLERELAERDATIAKLGVVVEDLRSQLEEWKRGHRVRDHRRRSKEKKAARAAKAAAAVAAGEAERKSGRPQGHEGSGRPGPTHVDRTVTCRSGGACACGGARADLAIGRRHRVEELVIQVEVTEYQCMLEQCTGCGAVTEARLPAELGGAPKIGPHAQAVAMALRFDVGVPVSAISRVFGEIFDLPFSPGGLSQMFERNVAKLEPATAEIHNRVLQEPVILVDETGWWQDGKRAWLSAAVTPGISFFHIAPRRDRAAFESVVPSWYTGIVATDAYSVYDYLPETRHPQCWAHPLRTARDIAEIHSDVRDAAMHNGIGAFITAAKAHREVKWPSPDTRATALAAFEAMLVVARAAEHEKLVTLGARLDRQRIRYLLCLDDKTVPLTTNQVERDLRGGIPVRKLSFGTRNPRGSLQWAEGVSIAKTLKKQRKHLVSYIPKALAAIELGVALPSVFANPH